MKEKNLKQGIPDRDVIDIDTAAPKQAAEKDGQDSQSLHEVGMRSYLFEFIDDEKLYSSSFDGRLTQRDIRGMLEVLHGQIYQNCPEAIRSYLNCHHLDYCHFKAEAAPLDHGAVMGMAEDLLKSRSCGCIDSHIGGASNYYAVMDHQKQVNGSCCEGGYYAVQRTVGSETYSCHIIGQTFKCGENPDGYFAIRVNDQNQNLRNLDYSVGEPVFPSFGCVDIIAILMEIDSIRNSKQAIRAAVK